MRYDMKQSGERIRQLRLQNKYTQETLAKELNIDRSMLSHIEAGKRGCSVELFVRLADIFDVSLDLLVLGKEPTGADTKNRELLTAEITAVMDRLAALKKLL